jgi:hypothetical protein
MQTLAFIGTGLSASYFLAKQMWASHRKRAQIASLGYLPLYNKSTRNIRFMFDKNWASIELIIQSLLPILQEKTDTIPLEDILNNIKIVSADKSPKGLISEEWKKLTHASFLRALASLYFSTLLSCFTAVQLSLMARRKYFSTLPHLYDEQLQNQDGRCNNKQCEACSQLEFEQSYLDEEQMFLSLSWFLLKEQYSVGLEIINEAAKKVLSHKPMHILFSYEDLCQCVESIRENVEVNDLTTWIMPQEGSELEFLKSMAEINSVPKRLQILIDEAHDFIECAEFKLVLSKSLDVAFGTFMHQMHAHFYPPPEDYGGTLKFEAGLPSPETTAVSKKFPIAKILPFISNAAKKLVYGEEHEVCGNLLRNVVELKIYAIIVYTGWE